MTEDFDIVGRTRISGDKPDQKKDVLPAEEPPAPRPVRPRKRPRLWFLLWSAIGIASLALLSLELFGIPNLFEEPHMFWEEHIACSGYKLISIIGSRYWFIACFALLFVLTAAAMTVTGIVRCVREDRDDLLGNVMAGETYAYTVFLAALYISSYYNKFWLEAQHPAGLLSISCLSYNKGSNWLTISPLGLYVRSKDCQPSPYCSVRFEQVEP